MFISFEPMEWDSDVACPKCKAKYHVLWSTEYGDPLPGFHSGTCPKCNATISFDCDVVTIYTQSTVNKIVEELYEAGVFSGLMD